MSRDHPGHDRLVTFFVAGLHRRQPLVNAIVLCHAHAVSVDGTSTNPARQSKVANTRLLLDLRDVSGCRDFFAVF